jgi:hypothetical protein
MSGSISLSLSQQFDSTGAPLNGGTLQFYAAGTTTPQSAYQDTSLTIPWPNPIVLDSAGRVPPFYLADGQIKIVLKDADGVTQVSADNLLVIGASSGTGSPPSVDATKIFDTGDLKAKYSVSAITGWVRANGRTIGSAASGGTERANSDCEDLFLYLWGVDTGLAVSTGRGASAAADWAANKNIVLPDWRGSVIAGFDDMGNTAAGRLTTAHGMSGSGIGGAKTTATSTLVTANLPPYTPAGTIGGNGTKIGSYTISAGGTQLQDTTGTNSALVNTPTFTGAAQGGTSTPLAVVQATMFANIYIKL